MTRREREAEAGGPPSLPALCVLIGAPRGGRPRSQGREKACTSPARSGGRKAGQGHPRDPLSPPCPPPTRGCQPQLPSPRPLTPDPCPLPRAEPSHPSHSYTRRPRNPNRAPESAHHSTARRRRCQSPEPGAAAAATLADTSVAATTAAAPALASTARRPLHPPAPPTPSHAAYWTPELL